MEQFHHHILTGEQLDLQAFARDFAAKELAPVVKECDRKGEFPMEVFRKFCEVGFNSMFLPEAYGGQGLGAMDMVLVYEEFAKVDAGFICSASTGEFGIEPILVAGTEEQKKYYMDFILQGGLGAFALTEPNAGSDAAATRTTAVRDGDDYILNGRKCFITSGPVANVYSVFATVDPSLGTKGISCFIVERDRPGVSVGKDEDKMGMRLSCTSDVIFEDVRIPAKNLVGAEGKGFGLAMKCLDRSPRRELLRRPWHCPAGPGRGRCLCQAAQDFRETHHRSPRRTVPDGRHGDRCHHRPGAAVAVRADGGQRRIRHKAGLRDQDLPERNGHAGHHQRRTSAGRVWLQP